MDAMKSCGIYQRCTDEVKRCAIIFFSLSVLIGCKEIYFKETPLSIPNQTSYTYPRDIRTIHTVLKQMYDSAAGKQLYFYRDRELEKKYRDLMDVHDAFIYYSQPETSQTYSVNNGIVFYQFHILVQCRSTSDSTTVVSVHVIDPKIQCEKANPVWFLMPNHLGMTQSYDAHPSSIEEYVILHHIGDRLGLGENMPAIRYPEQ